MRTRRFSEGDATPCEGEDEKGEGGEPAAEDECGRQIERDGHACAEERGGENAELPHAVHEDEWKIVRADDDHARGVEPVVTI